MQGMRSSKNLYNKTELTRARHFGWIPVSTDTTPPTAPTNLSGTAVSTSQINLTWTASTDNVGVAGYKVFRNGTPSVSSFSDAGLAASTAYSYTIAAYDAAHLGTIECHQRDDDRCCWISDGSLEIDVLDESLRPFRSGLHLHSVIIRTISDKNQRLNAAGCEWGTKVARAVIDDTGPGYCLYRFDLAERSGQALAGAKFKASASRLGPSSRGVRRSDCNRKCEKERSWLVLR
jgi:hypothetical protein